MRRSPAYRSTRAAELSYRMAAWLSVLQSRVEAQGLVLLGYVSLAQFVPICGARTDSREQTAARLRDRAAFLDETVFNVEPEPQRFLGRWDALKPDHTYPSKQGLVEYGLILVLIMVVVVSILTLTGQTVSQAWYQRILDSFPG